MSMAAAALCAALAAGLAGCGDQAGPEVATAGGSDQAGTSPAPTKATVTEQEKGIMYARCMTEMGVPVADPVDGAYPLIGGWGVGGVEGFVWDDEVMAQARIKCKPLFPRITYSRVQPDEIEPYRKYSACLRDLGITEGLLEPDDNGVIAEENNVATSIGAPHDPMGTAEYKAAYMKCQHLLPPSEQNGGGEGMRP